MIAVGAPAHYYTHNPLEHHNGVGIGPYAAVITQVSDRFVNLKVFPPFAAPYDAGSVMAFEGMTGVETPYRWFEEVTLQVAEESEVAIHGLGDALAALK